jgi:ATP-binding cassette, subfamily B, multidrug efflux pump
MAQEKQKIFKKGLLTRVLRFVQPYKGRFYFSIFLSLLLALLAPLRPYLVQLTVDKGIVHDAVTKIPWYLSWLPAGTADFVLYLTIIQLVLIVVETALRFYFSFTTAWMGQRVVNDLRVQVFQKITGLNLRQFDTTPIGTLTTRTINDIESINDIFSDGLIPILSDLLSILITLAVMLSIDAKLTLFCLIPFPFLIVATYYFKESVNKSFIKVRNAIAALNAFVQEHITGMMVVQAFGAEQREMKKFEGINKEHRNANINAIFAYSVFFPVVELILAISIGLLVWWVAGAQQQPGVLMAFILFLNQMFRPLRVIADKFNVLQMGMIASERVFKVLDNEDYIQQEGTHAPSAIRGEVKFSHVSFAYVEDREVLKNVSFDIRAGETLAIVGHTGSGKTSIISLINRMYQAQQGNIAIDGVSINDFSVAALRSHIGVVLQDVFLFSGSILDNVTLRNPNITEQQVVEAAKMIGVHDFIMRLPNGYHYNVMERGNTLSLGQRQLLSFIRALLYNPSILILDEATSSVDTESEQLIQRAIDQLITGRTAIVIAHRLSTIRKANKILVLDKGEVKELGTHEALMAQKGDYYKLHQMQFENQEYAAQSTMMK